MKKAMFHIQVFTALLEEKYFIILWQHSTEKIWTSDVLQTSKNYPLQ